VTAKLRQPVFIYLPEKYWDMFRGNNGSSRMETQTSPESVRQEKKDTWDEY
jgi:hypothetical protein